MGRWGDGEMGRRGRWGDGEMGRRGEEREKGRKGEREKGKGRIREGTQYQSKMPILIC